MHFNVVHSPILNDLIQAFSWTLIHSLWQGLILAVLTGLVLLLTRKSKPALRYNGLLGLMLLFVVGSSVTFFLEFEAGSSGDPTPIQGTLTSRMSVPVFSGETGSEGYQTVWPTVIQFFSKHATVIVLLWMMIFLAKSLFVLRGTLYVHQLRKKSHQVVGDYWQGVVEELGSRLGIVRPVLLKESELIRTPSVLGFLKPLILVPMGMLGHLPIDQVEAILLHELAHIRRQDYLINIFQILVESVYFFNPALLWVSYLIREEREHCCDDLAISAMQNKRVLVNALMGFQTYQLSETNLAMGFAGKRNLLLNRIKRIMYSDNKPLDAMEKVFVTVSLMTIMGAFVTFAQEVPQPPKKAKQAKVGVPTPPAPPVAPEAVAFPVAPSPPVEPTEPVSPVPPTSPTARVSAATSIQIQEDGNGDNQIETTCNGKRYLLRERDGEIINFQIDGKVIGLDKLNDYQDEVKFLQRKLKGAQLEGQRYEEEGNKLHMQADSLKKAAAHLRQEALLLQKEGEVLRNNGMQLEKAHGILKGDAEKQKAAMEALGKSLAETKQWSKKEIAEFKKQMEVQKATLLAHNGSKLHAEVERYREEAQALAKVAIKLKEQAGLQRMVSEELKAEFEQLHQNLIEDLKKEGLIENLQNLSYKLSDTAFIVNGKKLSDELRARFKAKYMKQKDGVLQYNNRSESN